MEALDAHGDLVPLAFEACWALRNVAGMDDTRALVAQGKQDTLRQTNFSLSLTQTLLVCFCQVARSGGTMASLCERQTDRQTDRQKEYMTV